MPAVLMHDVETVSGLAVRSSYLVWHEWRSGTSRSGCVGGTAVAVLMRVGMDGTGLEQAAIGDACYGSEGPVLDDENAYWITSASGQWTVRQSPLVGTAGTAVATSSVTLAGLTRDAEALYWYQGFSPGGGAIMRRPLAGGSPETVVLEVAPWPSIAIGGDRAWISDGWRIKSVGLDGSSPNQLFHADDGIGELVYSPYPGGSLFALRGLSGQVIRVPAAGGAPVVVCAGPAGPAGSLRNAAGFLYWIVGIDSIWRVAEGGGAAQRIATGLAGVAALAADAQDVFAYENDSGHLIRFPASGGPGELIASPRWGVPTPLAVDGDWLYWASYLGVGRVRKAGGGHEQVLVFEPGWEPTVIAIDEASIYVALSGGGVGAIVRITPK
jgi:hypothetical protein